MNAIDLFGGCGGLSRGVMDAGYEILLGVDNDDAALKTFAINHDGAKVVNADLSEIDSRFAMSRFFINRARNFDDTRNRLYLAVFQAVKELSPKHSLSKTSSVWQRSTRVK